MLTRVDTRALTSEKSRELLARSSMIAWAACASIWSRVFVLSGSGWRRAPELFEKMCDAFSLAMQRTVGVSALPSAESLLSSFEAFSIEDDGSAEWNYMIDLIEMISAAVGGQDISSCLETALRVYLEGTFNARARVHAVSNGRPISYAEAKSRVANDAEWKRTVDFVMAL
jgi:hypothetical protein